MQINRAVLAKLSLAKSSGIEDGMKKSGLAGLMANSVGGTLPRVRMENWAKSSAWAMRASKDGECIGFGMVEDCLKDYFAVSIFSSGPVGERLIRPAPGPIPAVE